MTNECPPPVGTEFLDDLPRCECGCEETVLAGKCHPRKGVHVIYVPELGALQLTCAECHELVVWIAVADKWQAGMH